MDDSALFQAIIADHSTHPRGFRSLEDPDYLCNGQNPLCGDAYTFFVIKQKTHLHRITFVGSGCALSKASCSILVQTLEGQSISYAKELLEQMSNLLLHNHESWASITDDRRALQPVCRYPQRVACAWLAWEIFGKCIG